MCACPWATFFFSLRRTFLTAAAGASLRWHARSLRRTVGARLLLAGLLLAGDGLLRALAGAGVGLGALAAHRQAAAVPDALVAADLDLAADVGGDLAAQVTLDLVVGLDVVAQLRRGPRRSGPWRAGPGSMPVAARVCCGAGAADPVDVGERDLHPLVAGEIDADETCHMRACSFVLAEVCAPSRPAAPPGRRAPASDRGWPLDRVDDARDGRAGGRAGAAWRRCADQPWRCLWRGFSQMTMTRPCRRMTLHLSQIFLTLGLTFTAVAYCPRAGPHGRRSGTGRHGRRPPHL